MKKVKVGNGVQGTLVNIRAKRKKTDFSSVGEILKKFQSSDEDKYISHEFQKYGYELAKELGDLKNKSLYIKLAKETSRGLLETARSFVKDAVNVKSRPKLFMWRLTQLKKEAKTKSKR
jgi:hypothetical protein